MSECRPSTTCAVVEQADHHCDDSFVRRVLLTSFQENFSDFGVTFCGSPHQSRHVIDVFAFNVSSTRDLQTQKEQQTKFVVVFRQNAVRRFALT